MLIGRALDPYVLGADYSLADAYLYMLASWFPEKESLFAREPTLGRNAAKVSIRPAVVKVGRPPRADAPPAPIEWRRTYAQPRESSAGSFTGELRCGDRQPPPSALTSSTLALMRRVWMLTAVSWACSAAVSAVDTSRYVTIPAW